jgi:hypothetical protein
MYQPNPYSSNIVNFWDGKQNFPNNSTQGSNNQSEVFYQDYSNYNESNGHNGFNNPPNPQTLRLEKFDKIISKYEIKSEFAIKLRQLEGFEIVIICDDSGSMNTPVTNPSTTNHKNLPSRWDELKTTVKTIIDIAGTLDRTGVDVYFLNRPCVKNVTDFSMIEPSFMVDPDGYTPITQAYSQVLNDMRPILSEKKLLIIIATDGEPTTVHGSLGTGGISEKTRFYNLVKSTQSIQPSKIYTTVLACTDDDSVISYLKKWDDSISNFDVVDDFHTVKENVQKRNGMNFNFSYGDYMVKTLLGSIDNYFDTIDEVQGNFLNKISCTIL